MDLLILGHLRGKLGDLQRLSESELFKELQNTCELIEFENYEALTENHPTIASITLKLQFYQLLLDEQHKEALNLLKGSLASRLDGKELAQLSALLFLGQRDLLEHAKSSELQKLSEALPIAANLHTRLTVLLGRAEKYQKSCNPLHCPVLCDSLLNEDLFCDCHTCKSFSESFEVKTIAENQTQATNFAYLTDGSLKHWNANDANSICFLSPTDYAWPPELLKAESFADGKAPHCLAVLRPENKAIWSTEERLTMLAALDDLRVIEHCWAPLRASYLLPCPEDATVLAIQNDGLIRQLSTRSSDSFAVLKEFGPPERNILVACAVEHKGALALSCNNDTIYWYSNWREYGHPTRIFKSHRCRRFHSGLAVLDGGSAEERDWLLVSASEEASVVAWAVGSGRCVGAVEAGPIVQLLPKETGFLSLSSDGVIKQWTKKA